MMKVENLMIGDWVKVNDIEHTHPLQVAEIFKKCGAYYATLYWDGMPDNVNPETLNTDVDKVLPIPLTPEILKKNGFTEQRGSLYVIDKREEYIGICLYRNTMRFTHEVYCSNVEDPDELLYSQELEFESYFYVHELQHLLRLCKIDKEIEL